MAIEDNVVNKLHENPTNEYASYKPNQLLANSIGNYITGMGFFYDGYISEPNSDELGIPVKLDIELNSDDVDVTMSDNVMYCYVNSDKLDLMIKSGPELYELDNFGDIIKNHHFVPVHSKAWRDATKLYLLKINLNTGIIGRYDIRTGRFKNQDINWNSSTPEEVASLLLPKEYLDEYLRSELCSLESYVSFASAADLKAKVENETIRN